MRLFIAIQLSAPMRRALTEAQARMRRQNVSGSFTPDENLHLTLAFIGDYPEPEDVPLPDFSPFEIGLSGCGAFGDLWWAGIERSEALSAYVRRLRRALSDAGIPFDRKRFSPHITLARRVRGQPTLTVSRAQMVVKRVCLMRSDRGKNGMIYTEVRGVDAQESR